jgi:hypothetical protein
MYQRALLKLFGLLSLADACWFDSYVSKMIAGFTCVDGARMRPEDVEKPRRSNQNGRFSSFLCVDLLMPGENNR